jgi:hypothetical protein
MNYHTTIPKILDTFIISLVLVPKKKHARPLDLFLTLLVQQKFKCQRFLWASSLNQILSLANYNIKIQINYTHAIYPKSLTT